MPYSVALLTVRPGGSQSGALGGETMHYLRRCGPKLTAELRVFRTASLLLAVAAEAQRSAAAALWLADRGGKDLTSEAFAERIAHTRDAGKRRLMIAVGPADGWTDDARRMADLRLSLGSFTLPHELAALVVAEQLFRASTIENGHPYHLGH